MESFWVIEGKHDNMRFTEHIIPIEASYLGDIFGKGRIKTENGTYYGTLNEEEWVVVDARNILYRSDVDDFMALILIILWCALFMRIILRGR